MEGGDIDAMCYACICTLTAEDGEAIPTKRLIEDHYAANPSYLAAESGDPDTYCESQSKRQLCFEFAIENAEIMENFH